MFEKIKMWLKTHHRLLNCSAIEREANVTIGTIQKFVNYGRPIPKESIKRIHKVIRLYFVKSFNSSTSLPKENDCIHIPYHCLIAKEKSMVLKELRSQIPLPIEEIKKRLQQVNPTIKMEYKTLWINEKNEYVIRNVKTIPKIYT